ncbi:hypothetical protein SynBIOSE41_00115 [Synechococcus sp. BIOS-E4-1]|nr:hypothetical protein SynBIOSE41_00115 [Synechococcus sp. BIOS-E4-1]
MGDQLPYRINDVLEDLKADLSRVRSNTNALASIACGSISVVIGRTIT